MAHAPHRSAGPEGRRCHIEVSLLIGCQRAQPDRFGAVNRCPQFGVIVRSPPQLEDRVVHDRQVERLAGCRRRNAHARNNRCRGPLRQPHDPHVVDRERPIDFALQPLALVMGRMARVPGFEESLECGDDPRPVRRHRLGGKRPPRNQRHQNGQHEAHVRRPGNSHASGRYCEGGLDRTMVNRSAHSPCLTRNNSVQPDLPREGGGHRSARDPPRTTGSRTPGSRLAISRIAKYTDYLRRPRIGEHGAARDGRRVAPRSGPCAISACEPRQGRKAAALSRPWNVPQAPPGRGGARPKLHPCTSITTA